MKTVLTRFLPHIAFLALIAWALRGQGVCCDDYPQIVLRTAASPVEEWRATPLLILTHGLGYALLGYDHFWVYDALKIGWVALAYAMAYRFAALWLDPARAALFAALFLLFPSHDSTVFWYSNQYLTLTSAFFLFAFALAERNRLGAAAALSALGSFVSYGSPPWAFGLGLAFALQRKWREALALVLPNLAYVAYYVVLTKAIGKGSGRLPDTLDVAGVAKQFLLQLAGGIEAVLGPSLWLKVWWSVGSLTLLSLLAGVVIGILLAAGRKEAGGILPRAVWAAAGTVALLGFAMFALTGFYPQAAFGVGNRVTIYASFPVALALAALARPRWAYAAVAAVLVFATLGVADHWRDWRRVQVATLEAIRATPELGTREIAGGTLFVVGRDYSRLGPIGHVAFFSDIWVTDAVFALALGEKKRFKAVALSSRFSVTPAGLVDSKHGTTYKVGEAIDVYDAARGELRRVAAQDLAQFVAAQRPPPRHWIQLVHAPWLTAFIQRWMPRLRYLFPSEPG
ncbi:MAG TPA: hypothetical protein VG873_07485 [Burkholderiales bacterium]|nr:hypothetical protein [Burkholderiales bacterium]